MVKVGFDPTAPDLHLGHTVLIRKMKHFQDLGHRVVFVVGDVHRADRRPDRAVEDAAAADAGGDRRATPRPTRRRSSRSSTRRRPRSRFNSEWLEPLGSAGWVQLAAQLQRRADARAPRLQDSATRPASRSRVHEFLYPLAQAYDSVFLEADVELGGTDQLFNLNVGRDIMPAYGLEPQVVMTTPLLEGLDGVEKMSKSLGNYVGVTDPPTRCSAS